MILVIDNYDSFTYNLVQYLGELGENMHVARNDKITLSAIKKMLPKRIIISPGPGTPRDAGISNSVIKEFTGKIPILGVCLGHQCIGSVFGAEIARRVLARYYPEIVTMIPDGSTVWLTSTDSYQNSFDYGTEMNRTRVTVDQMMQTIQTIYDHADHLRAIGLTEKADSYAALADVFIIKAETYLESRRVIFYENGYPIRRMNQAYFAFYGGYQGGIPGIGGEDPIGPAVRELRSLSADLHAFIVAMRGITTRSELLAVRDQLR